MASPSSDPGSAAPSPGPSDLRVQVVTQTPVPHHGTLATPAAYAQQWAAWWVVLALLIGAVMGSVVTWLLAGKDRATGFRLSAWGGFIVGIVGAVGHIVFVDLRSDEKFIPVFDETTLFWAAIAVASLLAPFVSEFSFGGASFKLAETQKAADDVVEVATDLTQNWTHQIAQFLAELEAGVTPTDFSTILLSFLKLRAYEATEWLSGDGEKRRLSLWMYDERSDELSIYFADGIKDKATLSARIKNGCGIVGTVYKLQQTWNERDAPSLPVWIPIRTGDTPRYHGIFLTPVNYAETCLGVLCVDRRNPERFSNPAEDVMIALASVFGMAIGNKQSQALLAGTQTAQQTPGQP